ncbi:polyhydroxyalkanoate synthesis repressor PhaR [Fodinicurvata sediminis]|uniref:polyhydroxyalkanoate synthesis repressor PhaR n=1 Tax=Fodinicurvata sediminis TaxID=1121832 RepID=UPI0003B69430|nr:polyhydroxyalkanoate synthesis repressor PhaR [Fodinicurvata sediminis]
MEKSERTADSAPITIKKYANRRLYNTATSSYVTLDHLCQMVKDDVNFVVYDAKSGDDITRSVLTQIIVEEEAKGENLLPISFLRQLISFYGHGMRWMLPSYLEQTMDAFAANQEAMAKNMQETMGGVFPFGNMEELGKQNMAMLQRTMSMFTPFAEEGEQKSQNSPEQDTTSSAGSSDKAAASSAQNREEQLEQLQKQVEELRSELGKLSKNKK